MSLRATGDLLESTIVLRSIENFDYLEVLSSHCSIF